MEIQDWLTIDEVKEYLDLKEWAEEEWVHLTEVQRRRELSKVHSCGSCPDWVLKLFKRIFLSS